DDNDEALPNPPPLLPLSVNSTCCRTAAPLEVPSLTPALFPSGTPPLGHPTPDTSRHGRFCQHQVRCSDYSVSCLCRCFCSIALYGLILFYGLTKEELAGT
ncbi:hypothetical protein BGY98DRAFT_1042798, partial [Russula aff. rugulosa BPL654]